MVVLRKLKKFEYSHPWEELGEDVSLYVCYQKNFKIN